MDKYIIAENMIGNDSDNAWVIREKWMKRGLIMLVGKSLRNMESKRTWKWRKQNTENNYLAVRESLGALRNKKALKMQREIDILIEKHNQIGKEL